MENLFTPDLFVVGGGVSKHADKWVPLLEISTPVKPAQLLNNAGIVGAAMAAHETFTELAGYNPAPASAAARPPYRERLRPPVARGELRRRSAQVSSARGRTCRWWRG